MDHESIGIRIRNLSKNLSLLVLQRDHVSRAHVSQCCKKELANLAWHFQLEIYYFIVNTTNSRGKSVTCLFRALAVRNLK